MKLHIDQAADALYLRLDDYNEANQVVGIELPCLSKRSPDLNLSTLKLVTA